MDPELADRFERAILEDGRYPPAAYQFLHEALVYTAEQRHGEIEDTEQARHVSGAELCEGARLVAQRRWGLLAPCVLRAWNIHRTRDFGEMVFLQIELGLMGRQDSDMIEDFDDVYEFEAAFKRYDVPTRLFPPKLSDESSA